MTRAEAATLLRAAGLRLSGDDLDALLRRTEGWPAALSLAALSLGRPARARARRRALRRRSTGSSPSTCATRCSPRSRDDELRFVLRTLDPRRADRAACDAVLERRARPTTLARLLRAGFPLVALDRTAERYPPSPPARRPAARRAAPRRAGARGRAAPARERLARARRRPRARRCGTRSPRTRSERAGDARLGRRAATPSSRARAPRVEHWLSRFTRRARSPPHPRLALAAAGDAARSRPRRPRRALARGPRAAAAGARRRRWRGRAARRARPRRARRAWPTTRRAAAALLAPDSPCQALCGLLARRRRAPARRPRDGARAGSRTAPAAPRCPRRRSTRCAWRSSRCSRSRTTTPRGRRRLTTRARSQVAPPRARALSRRARSCWRSRRSCARSAAASRRRASDAREAARAARAADRLRALVRGSRSRSCSRARRCG